MNEEKLKLIRLADVETQEVSWLWYPYLPKGKVSMIQGDPGEGKTMLALSLIARLTTGAPLPEQAEGCPPLTVIYQTAEDGLADTIKPRLEKAGADCSRVVVIDESAGCLSLSDERIEQAIVKTGAQLFVLDPLQAYLGAHVDMHRANEVRPAFRGLANAAERTHCAIVAIGHMNKMQGAKGMYRGLGSIDIAAICRSILYVGRSKDDEEKRYMAHLKSSLAPVGQSIVFTAGDTLRFIGTSPITAEKLLNGGGFGGEFAATKTECAVEALLRLLGGGEIPCSEVYEYCEELGISGRTVDKAKRELGVKSVKRGSRWYWSL